MKTAVICLLLLALVSGGCGLALSNANASYAAKDYEEIVAYVLKVEKESFHPKEFEKFALDRKVARKNVILQPWVSQTCHRVSLLLLVISMGLILFQWPKMKQEPTQPAQTTPGLRPSVSDL